ncbi:Farnesyl pyrophosphate synthase [Galemys pyrenaicus]|uniref:Farnesyl pyrophosphate synthase n=1 Tax=Galemys pyrenaicus TaxID=202257 RepID=A0A8J6DJB8_GALPY|nr:Farnesyl pyrophosphate synthase [Galemys pyrenaicus]
MPLTWRKEVPQCSATRDKYQQSLAVLIAFQELMEPRRWDADGLQWALAGLACELVHTVFLESHGIVNSSLTQWEQPAGIRS